MKIPTYDACFDFQQTKRYAHDLAAVVKGLKCSMQNLEEAYIDTVHRLALAVEYKDEETGAHVVRLSRYAERIAQALGMDKKFCRLILFASPMHDVGKIGIPDSILMKPARLTQEEFTVMQTHPAIGARLLSNSRSEILRMGEVIALTHHEKWNGSGYPAGLSGEAIPLEGRIVAIADVFDALTSRRPYKEAYSTEKSLGIMRDGRGSHFDPTALDCFLESIDDILAIKEEVDAVAGETISDHACSVWHTPCEPSDAEFVTTQMPLEETP